MARKPPAQFLIRGDPADRRSFLRETVGKLVDKVAEHAEERVAPRRFFRPPGALPEVGFLAACTRCSECIDVCPPRAIFRASPNTGLAAGTPIIDPELQPCTVCNDMPCAAVCPTEALSVPAQGWQGYRMATLELYPERCIAFEGKECGVCVDSCPVGEEAITLDGEGRPVIRDEGCVGCGVCVRACVTTPSSLKLHLGRS